MSKSYDEGYVRAADEFVWTCSVDAAAQTHSDYTQTEAYSTFGGPDSLIKDDLTVAQLNDPEFGVTFKVTAGGDGAVVRLDAVKVRVLYRQPLAVSSKDARRPNALSSVAVLGDRFVVTGAGGRVLTSDDNGDTWNEQDSGVLEDIWQVRQVSGVLFAVGDNGLLMTSTDGETWVRRSTGTDLSLRGVSIANNNVVVVGKSDAGIASSDNTSWRPV